MFRIDHYLGKELIENLTVRHTTCRPHVLNPETLGWPWPGPCKLSCSPFGGCGGGCCCTAGAAAKKRKPLGWPVPALGSARRLISHTQNAACKPAQHDTDTQQ